MSANASGRRRLGWGDVVAAVVSAAAWKLASSAPESSAKCHSHSDLSQCAGSFIGGILDIPDVLRHDVTSAVFMALAGMVLYKRLVLGSSWGEISRCGLRLTLVPIEEASHLLRIIVRLVDQETSTELLVRRTKGAGAAASDVTSGRRPGPFDHRSERRPLGLHFNSNIRPFSAETRVLRMVAGA